MLNPYAGLIAGAFVCLALSAQAATRLPDVIVSGARTGQSALTTPASIQIITEEQIAASGARHVAEVLRGQGGIQLTDPYGDGTRAAAGMRGFGETANANTLILVDGRRLNNPDIAAPDLNSIPVDSIRRIEIVQGSAGVLFGDQAVGGVINIITKAPAELQTDLKLTAGSYETLKFNGSSSRQFDNGLNYRVSADAHTTANYRDHNEASYYNLFGRVGYDYGSGDVFAEYRYINDELDTPGTLFDSEVAANRRQVNPNFANDFSDLVTRSGRAGIVQQLNDNWSLEGELTHRDSDGIFRLSSVFGAETQDGFQYRTVNEFTPRLVGVLPAMNDTLLTLGVDLISSDYRLSTRFGDQSNDQAQQSLYAQAVVPASASLDVTLGYRYARVENELRDDFTFPNGRTVDDSVNVGELGVVWRSSGRTRWMLRADQNYRFAKVDEYTNAQPFPSPPQTVILKTQTGLSLEAGVEWTGDTARARLSVYRLDLDDELAFDPVQFININLDETRRTGLIGELRWPATSRIGLGATWSYTDAEVLSGAYEGREVPFVAKQSGLLSVDYSLTDSWQLYGELFAISDRVFSGDFNNVLSKLPGYGVVNVKAEYSLGNMRFATRINNLLDRQYADVGQLATDPDTFQSVPAYFPSPEINFMLTAAVRFR